MTKALVHQPRKRRIGPPWSGSWQRGAFEVWGEPKAYFQGRAEGSTTRSFVLQEVWDSIRFSPCVIGRYESCCCAFAMIASLCFCGARCGVSRCCVAMCGVDAPRFEEGTTAQRRQGKEQLYEGHGPRKLKQPLHGQVRSVRRYVVACTYLSHNPQVVTIHEPPAASSHRADKSSLTTVPPVKTSINIPQPVNSNVSPIGSNTPHRPLRRPLNRRQSARQRRR